MRGHAKRLGEEIDLEASKARIDAIGDGADSKAASEAVAVDGEIGPLAGHLAGLAFAAESDALARRIAHNNGVTFAQAMPRVIVTSVEGGQEGAYRVALDLRLDEVEAWPYPGYATRAAEHFQSARGIQNTMLEGHFIERLLGVRQTANTADLIAGVEGGQGAMLVFGAGQEGRLDRIEGLSPYARRLIEQSLRRRPRGHHSAQAGAACRARAPGLVGARAGHRARHRRHGRRATSGNGILFDQHDGDRAQ